MAKDDINKVDKTEALEKSSQQNLEKDNEKDNLRGFSKKSSKEKLDREKKL